MRIQFYILLVFLIGANYSQAQIRTSVSNLLRYGNGDQTLGNVKNDFRYFENLTDIRFSLPENVNVGFRLLYDDPPEVGLPFQGLARRFVEYRKDNIQLVCFRYNVIKNDMNEKELEFWCKTILSSMND